MKTNTYMNFAKRFVMVLAVGLMAVNVWGAYSGTFNRISDESELTSGDSVMLVLQNGLTTSVGLAVKEGANNANCESVSIGDGPAITCTNNALVWKVTITEGTGSDPDIYVFTRGNDTKCVGWKANTDVYCNKSTTSTDISASSWTVTKLSDGYFEIQSTGTGNRFLARGTSDVFKAYATSNFINQMTLDTKVTLAQNHGAMSIYKKGAATHTVTINRNNNAYGTVSQASVSGLANNTDISASDNVLTIGTTTVTATPTEQDADFNYAFSSWDGIPAGGKVTGNITVTANFTRTARSYVNYRTRCCVKLDAPTNVEVEVTGTQAATVTWDDVESASGYEYTLDAGENWTAATSPLSLTSAQGLEGATSYAIQVRATGDETTYCADGTAADAVNFKTWSTVTAASNYALMGSAQVSLTSGSGWASSVAAADGTKIYLKATATGDSYEWYEWATPASGSISDNELTGWSGNVIVTANFRTKSLTKLATPTGMASSSVTAISAVVSWTAVDHASGYTVTCEKTSDGSTTGIVIGDVDGTSCTISGLTANTGYTWTVKAVGDNSSYKDGDACEGQTFTTDKKKPATVEITTTPSKTTYNSGETFVADGMVVKVTYNNGDIDAAYTGYTISKTTALSPSDTYVTITATMNEVSASVNQAITVNAKLTWKAAGAADVTTYASGGKVVMPTGDDPTAPSCLGDFDTFQGWSASAISVSTTTEPTYVSAETDATTDATFYAVFAKMGEGDEEDANSTFTVKAASAPGSPYVAADGATWTYNTTNGTMNFENGANAGFIKSQSGWIQVVLPESATEAISYVVTKTSNSWSGDAKSKLSSGTTDITDITGNALSYNFTNSNKTLGTYKLANVSSTTKACFIDNITINYKKTSSVPVEWATTCCTPWEAPAISYDVLSGWKNGDAAVSVSIAEGDTYGSVTYESSNTDVLTVNETTGAITAVAPGTATVTATWAGATVGVVKYCSASSTSDEIEVSGTVTVKFDGNGNDDGSMSDQVITYKTATNLTSNAFSKTGYSFGGWAESAAAATAKTVLYTDGQSVTLTAGCTLYAIWNINSHAVTLTQPTGNTIEATGAANLASVAYGADITLTASENDGYVFTGWSTSDVVLANTNPVVFSMPDNDVTVTATYSTYTWETASPRYTVTTAPKIVYNKVETFSTAGAVIKENFKRSDNNELTKQETYSGAWTAKLNGVAIANGDALSLENNGQTLKLYIGEAEIASYTLTVNDVIADQFVDGLWGNATQIITDDNYTVPSLSNQTLGDAATCKDHNIFIGWVLAANADEPTDDNKVVAGTAASKSEVSRTYYAIWAKHYSGNKDFDASKTSFANGEAGSSSSVSINTDISYTTAQNGSTSGPAVVSGGKLRLYRKNSGDYCGGYITISAASGATISAVEFAVSSSDAVKYRVGEYSAGNMSDVAITNGKVTVSGLSATKFTLVNADNGDQLDISSISIAYSKHVEEDKDYITDCDPRYDVEFLAGTGATGSYDKVTKKAGVEITLPDGSALSKDHHTFIGWRDNNAGTGTLYTTTYTVPANNVTLYAQWQEDHHAFVHFMDGENEVANSPIKVYDGGTYNLLAAPSAPANKLFVAWSWNNASYTAGQQNQHMDDPAEDRTYTAVWLTKQTEPEANVDLTNGKWILVKDANQLNAGDFIVIAAANSAKALSTKQKSSNRGDVDVTKTNDTLSFTTNVAPLFLQRDVETGFYALYDRAYGDDSDTEFNLSGYLFANGGSNSNTLKTQENITMQGLWSISIANKQASIVAQGNNSNRIMRYNSGSNLFTCYGSETQQPIAIYKWYKTLAAGTTDVASVEWTDAIIVPNGATLNVPADATLDNVIVENGGKVTVAENKTLAVNDLTIQSKAGESGQLLKGTGSSVTVNGDIYMDIKFYSAATLDETSANQWYMISAPFAVNLNGGFINPISGETMTFGQTDGANIFDLFEYDGSKRANTGVTGWKRVQSQMPAGRACLIGFNPGQPTTIRLKAASNTISETSSIALTAYPSTMGDTNEEKAKNSNWNGVANPNFHYTNVDQDVQIWNNEEGDNGRKYLPYTASTYSFVVGTPFFVQGTEQVNLTAATHNQLRAPKREVNERIEYCVQITREGASEFADQMYVRASEEATNTYEQGHDMITWNAIGGKSALLWSENYGMRLAIEEALLVNNQASYTLGIYAPNAGAYTISVPTEREDATLYMTYEGRIIWNLSTSAYTADLQKGQNNEYGLLLVAGSKVSTDIEAVTGDGLQVTGVQKVILDNKLFILRDGRMYDTTGAEVR